MARRRYFARTWDELFNLQGFHREPVLIEVVKTGRLASIEYDMPRKSGMQPCGILGCEQPHFRGRIIELPDLTLTHVGKDCGRTHFGTEAWAQLRREFNVDQGSAHKARAYIESLFAVKDVLDDPPDLSNSTVNRACQLLAAFDVAPEWLREALLARAPSNDMMIREWDSATQAERAEDKYYGRTLRDRVLRDIAKIDGITCLRHSDRVDTLARVRIPKMLVELGELASSGVATAKDLREGLRRYQNVHSLLAASLKKNAEFFAAENLAKLVHLPAAKRHQVTVVRLAGQTEIELLTA